MSAVRMCDSCGEIFSEREDGWASGEVARMARDERGQMRRVAEQLDTCSKCTTGTAPRPRLAIDSATGVDRVAKTLTQAEIDERLNP